FGIAKIMMSEGIATQRLTQTGEVFGSPLYMSPEQCMARDLDARSDVYAMGCVLYEAITGSPPLRGGNVFETFYLQAHEKPQSITTHVANIKNARSLDAIILKCMAKNARDRYQSMAELKAALQAYRQEFSGPGFFKTIGKKLELFKAEQSASKKVIPLWKMMLILTGLLFVVGTAAHWSGWLHSQPSGTASEPWEVHNMRGQKAFDDGDYAKARSEFFQALRKALGADGMEALVADSLSKEEPQSPPLIRAVENNAKSDLVGLSVAHLQDLYSTTGKGNQMSAMVKAVNSKRQEQRQSHKDILAEIGAAKDAEHRSELIRNLLDTLPSDDVDARVDAISKALAIVGPSANDIDRARLLGRLGYALMAKGGAQQGKALKCLTESFFIYERLKPRQSYLKPQGSLLVLLAYACDPKDFTELKRLIAQKIVEARKWCGRDSLEIATLKFALGTIYSRQYAAAANDVLRSSVTESKRAAPQQSLSDLRKRAILQFQAATAIYDRQLSMFNAEGKSVSNIEVRLQDYALHNELAGLYRDGNELSKAKHEYASVLKQLEECQQPLWEHLAQVLEQLARMEESKDPAKAAAMYKRALAINKRIGADQRTLSRLEERIEKLK
ncbi:MAG TPA: protein kinase, partial [Candidatus Obscuribacterales bacterium]